MHSGSALDLGIADPRQISKWRGRVGSHARACHARVAPRRDVRAMSAMVTWPRVASVAIYYCAT